ncbi:hypothetical protein ES705_39603 [subsurface metagenome]
MAVERLSKLQKWILVNCFRSRNEDFPRGFLFRSELKNIKGNMSNSFQVSLSRSIWSLISKGYATGLGGISVKNMAMIYGMQGKSIEEFNKVYGEYKLKAKMVVTSVGSMKAKAITLTEKGEEQAKKLLMLNSDRV